MTSEETSKRQRAEDQAALPSLLASHKNWLLTAWTSRVVGDPAVPAAKRLPAPELRDSIPEFVDALVDALMRGETSDSAAHDVGRSGTPKEHARQRLTRRYTLEAVLREWSHFRDAFIDLCGENGLNPPPGQLKAVHKAIDVSIAEAAAEMQEAALGTVHESLLEERRLSARLREEGELREQFLAVLGHDLRNPLNTIVMGATSLLKGKTSEKHDRVLTRIASSAARMARMIDDLLDITRVRLGEGLHIATERVDMCDLCRHIVEEFEMSDPEREVTINCASSISGMWDRDRVSRAVSNLVKNALVHGAQSSPVLVEVAADDATAEITVTNEGHEIKPEAQAKLFRPFGRGGHDTGERLGLGLYIVRQIALAHGGDISFSSEHGKTSFTLRLPREPETG